MNILFKYFSILLKYDQQNINTAWYWRVKMSCAIIFNIILLLLLENYLHRFQYDNGTYEISSERVCGIFNFSKSSVIDT
jgi:hypothetical protein